MIRKQILDKEKTKRIKLIDSMNALVGSWPFLLIHIILFIVWLTWERDIDTLTLFVSWEAIILMILLLMAQNRQGFRDDLRDEADLQADLQSVNLAEKILKEVKSIKQDIKNLKK